MGKRIRKIEIFPCGHLRWGRRRLRARAFADGVPTGQSVFGLDSVLAVNSAGHDAGRFRLAVVDVDPAGECAAGG